MEMMSILFESGMLVELAKQPRAVWQNLLVLLKSAMKRLFGPGVAIKIVQSSHCPFMSCCKNTNKYYPFIGFKYMIFLVILLSSPL